MCMQLIHYAKEADIQKFSVIVIIIVKNEKYFESQAKESILQYCS